MLYDVAIIGAGPAGVVVARLLQRSGLQVLVINGAAATRTSSSRAETIGASTISQLKYLGFELNAFSKHIRLIEKIESNWGGELWTDSGIKGDTRLIVERNAVDDVLRDELRVAGVQVVSGKVTSLLMDGSFARLKLLNGVQFDATFVVDASGRAAQWAKQEGLGRSCLDSLISISAEFQQGSALEPQLRIEAVSKGWIIVLIDAKSHAHVSLFVDRDLIPAGVPLFTVFRNGLLEATSCQAYRDAVPLNPLRLWPATTTILNRCFSARLLAVGDAAQTQDPLSGGGMAAAIESASSAAESVIRLFRGDKEALPRHEWARRREFASYLQMRSAYYSLGNRWPFSEFWSRRCARVS